ncbi:NB-ARC domain-containing protein, partial [Laspinema olomoucense]
MGIRRWLKQLFRQQHQGVAVPSVAPELPKTEIRQNTQGDRNQVTGEVSGDHNTLINAEKVEVYLEGRGRYEPRVPFQAPTLPNHFLDRPDILNRLKSKLLAEELANSGGLIVGALFGLGGIGKSVLAAALARSPEVQAQFPDGVLWVTLGQEPNLLSSLSGWIQALGDRDFKGTTVEMASSHLQSLLFDKTALLVVDDAWDAAHVDPFRVGGKGCRVLVTTREVVLSGVEKIEVGSLDPEQSLELLERLQVNGREISPKDRQIAAQVADAVGGLPLALELVGALVAEGLRWQELRADLDCEIKRLEVLNLEGEGSQTALDRSNEKILKNRSLLASFNLSLRRLGCERLGRFAWLGLLPEDGQISARAAAVLWDVEPSVAGRELFQLRQRALLLEGQEVLLDGESEPCSTYKLHDLIHHTARKLVVASPDADVPGLGLEWRAAHRAFLGRYRDLLTGGWSSLGDDGYIHQHLTWHFLKAGWDEELHQLLAEETPTGRNAWYEAVDRLGLMGSFVEDVARAWEQAEALFATEPGRSVGLQCRYALMLATLNSLLSNLPPELLVAAIKQRFWTPAKVFGYIQQLPDEQKQGDALEAVIPLLPESLLPVVLEIARAITDESRIRVWYQLSQRYPSLFPEALEAASTMRAEAHRGMVLSQLSQHLPESLFPKALETALAITEDFYRAIVLCQLSHRDPSLFPEALKTALAITDESSRTRVLCKLSQHLPESLFPEILKDAIAITNESYRAQVLSEL